MDVRTARLAEIAERRNAIRVQLEGELEIKVLEELEEEVEELIEEEERLRKEVLAERSKVTKVITPKTQEERNVPLYESAKYREAFKNYVMGRSNDVLKMREDDEPTNVATFATDASAIIPTTIVDNIIRELASYGDILGLVTFTNFKGGVAIPIAGTKPTASWVSEGETALRNKQAVTGKVVFTYHKLQIQVSITLLAQTITLDAWEKLVAENVAEAMAVALETAVIEGTGSGQPLGILKEPRITATQKVDFAIADATYNGWLTNLIGSMPLAYRGKNNVIIVNPLTWDKYMAGMVDDVGQPVARVNYGINGEEVQRFFGKRVILTESVPSLDEADEGDAVAIFGDLSNYMINTNLAMNMRTYIDEDTDEIVRKTTMIVDGKLADVNGFIILELAEDDEEDEEDEG